MGNKSITILYKMDKDNLQGFCYFGANLTGCNVLKTVCITLLMSIYALPALSNNASPCDTEGFGPETYNFIDDAVDHARHKFAAYTKCISDSIDEFKSTDEAVDIIVMGALGNCQVDKSEWLKSMRAACIPENALKKIEADKDEKIREWAISLILQHRLPKGDK